MNERLVVVYEIAGPSPRDVVDAIRVEQTIEFPYELAPAWIQETVVGRVEDEDGSRITVSYAAEVLGGGLVQLLNVVWGNVSLYEGVRVVGLELPDAVLAALPGPRFGVPGLRELLGAPDRALLATALKPMGRSAVELAADATTIASAGFDVVKDDHGLADQPWARWEERVARCAEAVAEANARTGGRTLYMPALNVPSTELLDRAHRAKELGAGALLVLPGLVGFDGLRALAADGELALPLMTHPSMLGSTVVNPGQGIRHGLLLGLLCRVAGADMCIFPNLGGRFSFTPEQCADIRDECTRELPGVPAAFPAPGGGMAVERVPELLDFYGPDVTLLVGGALHRGDLAGNARAVRERVDEAARA